MYQYNVYNITMEQLKEMIAAGDDSKQNQIIIKHDGTILLSTTVYRGKAEGIAARFEAFDANNNYVGQEAADRINYITSLFLTIKDWVEHPKPYIDIWIQV